MFVYAIVAVKGLSTSKKRLSPVLSPQGRRQLTQAMLKDVLTALKASTVNETVIISTDSTLCDLASKFNAASLVQKSRGLNLAIDEATDWCMRKGAEAALILPADLPMLSFTDVDRIIELGNCTEQIVLLSPSYDGGTNVLFQSPPNLIHACFGPRSFSKHFKQACRRAVRVKFYYSLGVAMDIDSPEDLRKLLKMQGTPACRRVMDLFGLDVNAPVC